MPGWVNNKLESRMPGEISTTLDMQVMTFFGRKWRGTKKPIDEGERGEWKSCLKTQYSKTKIMASNPIKSQQIEGEKVEAIRDFLFLGSKITVNGDCGHEIKRCLLLGKKTLTNLDSVFKSRHHFAGKGSYSQSYGFSSSHVQVWELDPKEGWALKN